MTRHPHILAAAIALTFGGSAVAAGGPDQLASFESADRDQNGSISFAEAQQVLELDQEQFAKADENADQTLSQAEYDYARTLTEGQTAASETRAAAGSGAIVTEQAESETHEPAGRNLQESGAMDTAHSTPAADSGSVQATPEPAGRSAPLTATGTVEGQQPQTAAQEIPEPAGRSAPQVSEADTTSEPGATELDTAADNASADRFATLDRDGDGTISREEASEDLQDEWSKADIDSNESIDRAEFSAFEESERN